MPVRLTLVRIPKSLNVIKTKRKGKRTRKVVKTRVEMMMFERVDAC